MTEINRKALTSADSVGGVVVDQPPVRGAVGQVNGQQATVPYVCVVGIGDDILDEIANRVVAKLKGDPPPAAASEAQNPNLPTEVPEAA